MQLIESSIRYPVSTAVGVILLILFGGIALFQIPVQMIPDIEEPKVTVTTIWPGASPQEMEREIVDEQEEQLKSLEGLKKIESQSQQNIGTVRLTFQVGTSLDAAALRVANRLEQVPEYPSDVEKPVIRTVDIYSNSLAWFVIEPTEAKGFDGDIDTLWDFADDHIKPVFERVPGIAVANIFGGRPREMQVIVDPAKLAARQVTMTELAAALDRENRNFSGGDFDEGKRKYTVRTIGDYSSPEDIEKIVITRRHGVPVYLRDVGRVQLGYRKVVARVFQKGRHVLAMNAIRQQGANSLETMAELQKAVAELNRDLLATRGLRIVQVYDETEYIHSAINLVTDNLYVGSILAVACLMLFLRTWSGTMVIATAIPISIVGSFIFLKLFGRTINVISLAGMAFAAGQVVDNSVVVLENIFRHRQMGKSRVLATLDGTREVWGAVLITTVTTVAVFIPIAFIKEEAGQLFADIAIAIAAAIGLSLLVCITVVPAMTVRMISAGHSESQAGGYHNLWGLVSVAERFTNGVGRLVGWILESTTRRLATVVVLTAASVIFSALLLPKAEYLPNGNSNFAFGMIMPPPGYGMEETLSLREPIEKATQPLWEAKEGTAEAAKLPGGGVRTFFYVAVPGSSEMGTGMSFMGLRANDPMRVAELIAPIQKAIFQIPGAIGFVSQWSLFQRDDVARSIDIEISGPDLETLIDYGGRIFGEVMQKIPGAQARPIPSLDLGNPEVQVLTHRRRAADVQVSNRELGFTVNALVDGAKVSDYRHEGKEIDMVLRGEDSFASRTHEIEMIPIATPDGQLVTLGAVAEVTVGTGPIQINHRERQRTITIQVQPPETMPLEAAMDKIENEILHPMEQEGLLSGLYRATLSGSADKLTQTARAFRWNFLLAVVITYLLMAALFESFLHPLVIMFSVPLGAVGGFLGLWAVNLITYQPLDVLTMLGFIILVGTVVNNATLVVHQSLIHIREEGMEPREAIREAVQNRMRPMFMTTGTNVMGTLPMVLFPGAGSELYRGLGAVFVGGLVVSTIFTLVLVPALFSLALEAQAAVASRWHRLLGASPTQGD